MKDKTRVLVTHAVEFISCADHVIIMKDGKVEAQGTYSELQSHPYVQQVQDISTKNQKEVEKASVMEAVDEIDLAMTKAKSSFDRRKSTLATGLGLNV